MPRPLRLFDPGSLLHVFSRASGGEAVFADEEERSLFVERLGEYCVQWDGKVYAYVVMPNHFHLCLEVGKAPLQELMHPLLTWYAGRYNWRQERQGHVFQGRYHAILLQRDAHLLQLIRYLHLNPVRAGLVKSPEAYAWSSHSAYCGGRAHGWLAVSEALGLFSEARLSALRQYRRFVQEGLSLGRRPELYRSRLPLKKTAPKGKPGPKARAVVALAARLGLPPDAFAAEHDPSATETRAMLVYLAVTEADLTTEEIARALGCHRVTVHRHLLKARELRKTSPEFLRRVSALLRSPS